MRHQAGLIALVVLAACNRDTPSNRITDASESSPPPAIQAMIAMVTIDSATNDLKPLEAKLKGDLPGDLGHPAKLWLIDGKPVKLVVTELNERGFAQGESTWYFRNDTLVAATAPLASYAFRDGRLAEWADRGGIVVQSHPDSLAARDRELKKKSRFWLDQFPTP